jgi:hypothetical protein
MNVLNFIDAMSFLRFNPTTTTYHSESPIKRLVDYIWCMNVVRLAARLGGDFRPPSRARFVLMEFSSLVKSPSHEQLINLCTILFIVSIVICVD